MTSNVSRHIFSSETWNIVFPPEMKIHQKVHESWMFEINATLKFASMVSAINDILSSTGCDIVVVYFRNLCFLNFQVPEVCCPGFFTVSAQKLVFSELFMWI